MTNLAMQQGAAASGQGLPADAQRAIEMAQQAQADAQAAAREAEVAAQAGAQGQNEAVVRIGPDGPLVIRDKDGRETVIIEEGAVPPWLRDGPPEGVFMIPIALFASIAFVIVGLPIARAFARRMDSRNAAPAAVAPSAELRQLQTSIDTMALEIERMSEHQRFLTRVLSEGGQTGTTPARDASSAVPR